VAQGRFLLTQLTITATYTVNTAEPVRGLFLFSNGRACSRKREINAVVEESSLPRGKETRGKVDFHSPVSSAASWIDLPARVALAIASERLATVLLE